MRKQTKFFIAILVLLTLGFTLFSCNSPLFGLGGRVDINVPGITITTVDEGTGARALVNGDYVRGTVILKGTASDDIAVASVQLQFTENGSTVTIPAVVASGAWQATINTTLYADGPKDFIATVTDSAGKTTETRFVIYFDNKAPVVMFSLIASEVDFSNNPLWGKITIKGSAADQFSIRKVRVYIYKKSDSSLVYASPDDASIGTNSFSLTLTPAAYGNLGNLAPEDAYFAVQAWDRSGNTNTWFYMSSLITALDPRGLTVEDIMALENGTETAINTIDVNELASTRRYAPGQGYPDTKMVYYTFDQSANLPIVTITNPEQGKTAEQNTISKNARASGVAQDANGVALVELQFRKEVSGSWVESDWYSDAHVGVAGDDIDVSGTGQVVNWSTKTLFGNFNVNGSALGIGVYELRIRATDADGNFRISSWVPFTIDADAPDISITSPEAGAYVSGNPVVIAGEARAYGTANVSDVDIYIDATTGWKEATTITGSGSPYATWTYNITQYMFPTDGLFTVKARVKDTPTNKEAFYNIVITVDRTAPSGLSFSSPASGTSVNGYKTIRGIASDNILLDKVYLVFEKNGEEILLEDTYSWSYSLDVNTLANITYGYDLGNNVYRVPIRIKAVDKAGNTAYTTSMGVNPASPAVGSYYLDVDPDGDRPSITQVLSPGNFGNTYATAYQIPGSIKVQGIASDDDAVHHVEMALMAIFDGTTERYCEQLTGAPGSITLTTTPTWHTIDGASLWYKILNNSGELYDLSGATGSPGGTHNGNFKIRLRAVDTKDNVNPDVTGNEVELYVRFDNTLPSVTGITPEENTVQRGTFAFSFTAQDNVKVTAAQISYNNGGTYTPIAITPAQSIPININIDTTTINSGQFNNSAGTLNLRIKLTDDSNNISERNIKYLIDNIAPTAALTTDVTDLNNKMIDYTTNLANILGTANDTGAVKGVKKVEVWFERNSVQIFPASGHVVIDRNENYNDGAGDGDGYPESFTQNSGGWQWGFRFNSSLITDGDITVHYLVFDEAGNSTEYTAAGAIKNNKPYISAIQLETDRNGDADTTDDEERVRLERQTDANGEYTSTWKRFVLDGTGAKKDSGTVFTMTNSALTVMNSRFTASFEVAGGNGTKYYYALAPNGSTQLLNWVTTTSYTVTNFASGGWTENANNTLSIQVRDSASGTPLYTAVQTFVVYVDNTDNTAPVTRMNQLSSVDVKDYDANNRANWKGHIEPWNQSPWNNEDSGFNKTNEYFGNDADVSGTIIFSGTATDDQRIQNFYMWLDLDGDNTVDVGEEQPVAAFSGSGLVAQANTLGTWSATTQSLNLSGHSVSWTFEWNSTAVSGVARNNVRVRARTTDFGSNTSSQLPAAPTDTTSLAGGFNIMKVDVVPYVTSLQTTYRTEGGLKDSTIRSSSGKYSVITGTNASFITVNGFNLNPNAVRIVNTASLATATVATGIGLAYGTPNGTYTSVSLTNASTASGYLEIFTNSVRMPNNIDNDTLPTNREPDQYFLKNNTLTNDRYIRFFTIRDTGIKNAYYPDMEMENDDPVFGYLNLSGGPNAPVSLLDPNNTTGAGSYFPTHAMPQRAKFTAAGVQVYKEYLIKASIWDQMAMAKDAGNRYYHITVYNRDGCAMSFIYDRYAELYTNGQGWGSGITYSGYDGNASHYASNNALTLERVDFGNGLLLGRYIYPKIKVKGNSLTGNASVYALYYDDNTTNRELIFRTFQIGTGALSYNLYTGGTSHYGGPYAQKTNMQENGSNDGNYNTGRITAASSASKHFDFVVTSTNRVVIIYYDDFAGRLVMVYSNAAVDGSAPTTNPGWTTSSISFPAYVGNYVSATIDASDGIHIAAYDSGDSNLVYMYISAYNSGTLYTVTVDQAFSVGNWTQIKLLPGTTIPYIAYYNATETGGRDSIKLAFCNSAVNSSNVPAGVDANGFVTGNWEFMTVPALTPPQGGSLSFKHVNLGFNSSNIPVISYLGTNLEFGYWLSE